MYLRNAFSLLWLIFYFWKFWHFLLKKGSQKPLFIMIRFYHSYLADTLSAKSSWKNFSTNTHHMCIFFFFLLIIFVVFNNRAMFCIFMDPNGNKPLLGQGFLGLSLVTIYVSFLWFVYCIKSCGFSLCTDFLRLWSNFSKIRNKIKNNEKSIPEILFVCPKTLFYPC